MKLNLFVLLLALVACSPSVPEQPIEVQDPYRDTPFVIADPYREPLSPQTIDKIERLGPVLPRIEEPYDEKVWNQEFRTGRRVPTPWGCEMMRETYGSKADC